MRHNGFDPHDQKAYLLGILKWCMYMEKFTIVSPRVMRNVTVVPLCRGAIT
jgi:hypothetical protein